MSWFKANPLVSFALSAAAILIVWFALANWLDDMTAWLPWSDESRLERKTDRADTAESDAAARGLEVEGEREQAARVDTFHRQVVEIHTITAEAVSQARSAQDANDPLPGADSLLVHQRRLCDASPRVCGSAAPGPPDSGGDAL